MADSQVIARGLEPENEIIPAIRHEDAKWKLIQQNTFTRWVNNHLKKAGESIQSLETDFSDGLRLIALASVLSQKGLGRYNKKVNFRSQKLENVSLAMSFFQDVEKIKIVNIDSTHIVDQNKKLIMGLIWTLIQHYSISLGWIQENRDGQPDDTPKQKLLNWIRQRLPAGMPLTNFTSDWNDGIALSALVNSLVPGSIPDWQNLHPDNALQNTQKALAAAQENLGVAPIIAPEELIHPEVDEQSVMTFLSQFPTATPQRKAKETSKPEVSCVLSDVEENPIVHTPTEFGVRINCPSHKPKVSVTDESNRDVRLTVTKKTPEFYNVKYTPTAIGKHKIDVSLVDAASGEIAPTANASAIVNVVPAPHLCPYPDKVRLGEEIPLRIENAGNGRIDVVVVDGENDEIPLAVISGPNGSQTCSYKPQNLGLHSINVFYIGNQLPLGPFPLRVLPKTPNVTVWGRGLAPDGVRVKDVVPVHILYESPDTLTPAALDHINVEVVDAGGSRVPTRLLTPKNNCVTFEYSPQTIGEHRVTVIYDGDNIAQTPYKVNVAPLSKSKVRAFGAGVGGGVSGLESIFETDTQGEADRLAFSIEGPSKTDIKCRELGTGAVLVSYKPEEPGVYKVNVLAGGEHIPESPFVFLVNKKDPNFQPTASRIQGLDPNENYIVGEPVSFQIDTKRTNSPSVPNVVVLDKALKPIPVNMREINPNLYEVSFCPQSVGVHHIDCQQRGVALPGAPFTVNVKDNIDVSKLRMYGPGVEGPVVSKDPTYFTIDAKQAGPGAVEVSLCDREGQDVDIDVLDHQDGSFTVKYTAPRPGAYQLKVVFAGEEIPPIEINVKPHIDVKGVSVSGLENAVVTVNCEKEMHVFTPDGDNTRLVIRSPSGRVVEAFIEETETGLRVRFTPSEIGDYSISVMYQDLPVEEPFTVQSIPEEKFRDEAEYVVARSGPARPDLVVVSGPGLGPVVAQCSTFVLIDTTSAGFGDIDLFVDGPSKTPIHCTDNQDGTLKMCFVPKTPGLYWLRVLFDRVHITGSPFQVVAVGPSLISSSSLLDTDKTESPFTSLSSGSSSQRTTPVV